MLEQFISMFPLAIRKAILRGEFEATEGGIYFPTVGKVWTGFTHSMNGDIRDNLMPTEGKNLFLNVFRGGVAVPSALYICPYATATDPVSTWTGANFTANAGEITTLYDESTRQAFTMGAASSGASGNSGSPATVTFNATVTINGVGVLTTSGKGNTAGSLVSAVRRGSSLALGDNDQLIMTHTITISDPA